MNKLTLTVAAGLAAVVPAHALAAGTDDDAADPPTTARSEPAGGTNVFVNEGDPAQQVLLVAPMTVGQVSLTEMTTVAGTIEVPGEQPVSTPIDVTTTTQLAIDVVTIQDDAGFLAETTVEAFDITVAQGGDMAGSFAFGDDYAPLEGMTLSAEYNADRSLVSIAPPPGTPLTAEQQDAIDELNDSEGGVTSALPTDPVGVGAEWQAPIPFDNGETVATFRLVSFDGSEWRVDFDFQADASVMDLPASVESATGTITASGTMTGNPTNPFVGSNQATLDFDLTFTGPEGVLVLDLTATTHQSIEPA